MAVGFTYLEESSFDKYIGLYVLAGWQCRTIMEFHLRGYEAKQLKIAKPVEVCRNSVYAILIAAYAYE